MIKIHFSGLSIISWMYWYIRHKILEILIKRCRKVNFHSVSSLFSIKMPENLALYILWLILLINHPSQTCFPVFFYNPKVINPLTFQYPFVAALIILRKLLVFDESASSGLIVSIFDPGVDSLLHHPRLTYEFFCSCHFSMGTTASHFLREFRGFVWSLIVLSFGLQLSIFLGSAVRVWRPAFTWRQVNTATTPEIKEAVKKQHAKTSFRFVLLSFSLILLLIYPVSFLF